MNKADFEYVKVNHKEKFIFIRDLNLGNRSVTNDAENVVQLVNRIYPLYRIIYQDTMLSWSELAHNNGVFTDFKPVDDVLINC